MLISYDLEKRDETFAERGLDMSRAAEVFAGLHLTQPDRRQDYGESRNISAGKLNGQWVVLVWTLREHSRRIISMRRVNGREIKKIEKDFG
jgi:uncharacterized protein